VRSNGYLRQLVLWDVDGTLLSAGAIGREAFYDGVAEVLRREVGDLGVEMSGKTDPLIALEILERLGIRSNDARRLLPDVLAALASHLSDGRDRIGSEGRVHPGVRGLLERLAGEDGVVQSVLTGNLAVNARTKVKAFGLERFLDLDVGAYGSDHTDRDQLVPVAVGRVRERYGRSPASTWVIGDTARDLACARAGGARCLLVATGRIPFGDLEALAADGVLADLADTDAVAGVLLS